MDGDDVRRRGIAALHSACDVRAAEKMYITNVSDLSGLYERLSDRGAEGKVTCTVPVLDAYDVVLFEF